MKSWVAEMQEPLLPSVQAVEKFQDFRLLKNSQFKLTIARVQQLALEKSRGPIPLPALQLELMNQKKNKQSRSPRERTLQLC